MTPNKTIYVDMDDVICETCRGFLALLESEFDRSVNFEDVLEFDLTQSFNMSQDELEVFMERAHQPEFLTGLNPMPGALETIGTWIEAGYSIEVRTGRPPSTRACTEEWLRRHEVRYTSLKFVDKYGRVEADPSFSAAMTLADLAGERFCLAVEDSAATATFLAENEVAPVFLIDRPWNRKGVGGDIKRMAGWQELARVWPAPDAR
jgi:uncharacterized HAD superfamily protein